ncbi:MAG: DHH family phosphoesterase [Lachnospiraceae bacterium]|nr:DHH family phosphoesterase [Lachnospiraceae bacterium]
MAKNIKFKGKLWLHFNWPFIIGLVFVAGNISVYFYDAKCGMAVSAFLVVFLLATLAMSVWSGKYIVNEIVNFATQYSTVQKQLLNEFQIPYALLDGTGKVLWMNEKFEELTGVDKKYHKSITGIFPALTKEAIYRAEEISDIRFEHEDKLLRASFTHIPFQNFTGEKAIVDLNDSSEFITALYIFDDTKLYRYKMENREQKQVAALVYIDNYDEALESMEDVNRSLLTALVDRKVNQYFTNIDALVRKIEKDKYFVVFKYKYLQQLEEDKFSILEDVKTVKVGNEIAVTLSIGVGIRGNNYNENYEYARASIDLALARGGDQAVVKNRDEIHYYGGKTQQVDRNTRVKARVKAQALREIMQDRDNVLIMGHNLSDVDSIGAGIGIYCAAKVLGKKAQIVVNEVTSSVRPMIDCFTEEKGYPTDMFIDSETALEMVGKNSLVMVVDTNKPSYTECSALLDKTEYICVFDHHRQGSEVIENPLLSYIEPYASSACEMVAEVLQYFQEGMKIEACEADCIYAGILIDTNNFMTKTGVRTFEAAAYLRRSGAEVTRVRKMLRNDMDAYKARAEGVRRADVYRNSFAISVCPAENIESPTIVGAQVANELLNIVGIKASFVLTEYNGRIYVSSRSIDEINVQIIMERLGGGGHLNVAGAQLTNCTVAEAKQRICDTLDEMIKEGEILE